MICTRGTATEPSVRIGGAGEHGRISCDRKKPVEPQSAVTCCREAAPMCDRRLHGAEDAGEYDRRGKHRRRMASSGHDQVSAEPQHRRLKRRALRSEHRSRDERWPYGGVLRLAQARVGQQPPGACRSRPSGRQRPPLHVQLCGLSRRLRTASLRDDQACDRQDAAHRREQSEQRMQQEQDAEIERHPRQIA